LEAELRGACSHASVKIGYTVVNLIGTEGVSRLDEHKSLLN
jgi:hypothetical protein